MPGAPNGPRTSQQASGAEFANVWKEPTIRCIFGQADQRHHISLFQEKGNGKIKGKQIKGKGEILLIWGIHSRQSGRVKKLHCVIDVSEVFPLNFLEISNVIFPLRMRKPKRRDLAPKYN